MERQRLEKAFAIVDIVILLGKHDEEIFIQKYFLKNNDKLHDQ